MGLWEWEADYLSSLDWSGQGTGTGVGRELALKWPALGGNPGEIQELVHLWWRSVMPPLCYTCALHGTISTMPCWLPSSFMVLPPSCHTNILYQTQTPPASIFIILGDGRPPAPP